MLKIGEFAGLTGLSVKALRHYDEMGVLVPADVDGRSAYRRYSEGQVRRGVVVRALRDAGVPLPVVSAALAAGEVEEALEGHRLRVLEQRQREDDAFRAAGAVLRALAAPVTVSERVVTAQPYAGQVITVPAEDAEDLTDEDANEVFGGLFVRIQEAGLGPSGPFWTALRAGERGDPEIRCCWPTLAEVPAGALGPDVISGTLPARTEIVAVWRPLPGEELPDGALHPAVVGLFDAIAERGDDLTDAEVRQAVRGESEDDYVVEISVTLSR
jgi:DNA-binding transcriptional MerR regulator